MFDDDRFRDYTIPSADLSDVLIHVEATGGIIIEADGPDASYELICEDSIEAACEKFKKILSILRKKFIDKSVDGQTLQKAMNKLVHKHGIKIARFKENATVNPELISGVRIFSKKYIYEQSVQRVLKRLKNSVKQLGGLW